MKKVISFDKAALRAEKKEKGSLTERQKQEAKELEQQVLDDPDLSEQQVPDYVFERIVKELKEKGQWEEETPEEALEYLSREDQEALELGRKVKAGELEARPLKRHGWRRWAARVAVVFLCVTVAGVSTQANRNYFLGLWNALLGKEINVSLNNEDGRERRKWTEREAFEDIEKTLGIRALVLSGLPEEMKFDNYDIFAEQGEAFLYYTYNDTIVTVDMSKYLGNTTMNRQLDGEVVGQSTVFFENIEVEIWEMENPEGENGYFAQFEHQGVYYALWGILPGEVFRELIEGSTFW